MMSRVSLKAITRVSALVVVTLTFSMHALAQSAVTGTWRGQTPNGSPLTLELVAKGTVLTGTMTAGSEKSALADGKVSKNTISFSVSMGGGTEAFSGEITNANQMSIWMDDRGPSSAITLTRELAKK